MSEFSLAEKPLLDYLKTLGYSYLSSYKNDFSRDGLNNVILRDEFIQSVSRINNVPEEVAHATYLDLLNIPDNEKWFSLLRGDYSRHVPGESDLKTIHVIDFLHPSNNTFTITNQYTVKAEHTRRADIVVFINGIPVVVIEAKSPSAAEGRIKKAYGQIMLYEKDIPKLFYSNAFNIVTDGVNVLYGTTKAPWEYWGRWKDPWPRKESDFPYEFELSLWSLLEPSRLLDIIAHFIVFETRDGKTIKKMCRYQQYRAANKLVERVLEDKYKRGLIWHTQGSGKSLTMVFSALKLKSHRTIESPTLSNPNLLVVTDRIDLDDQIAKTFQACGLPNPIQMESVRELRKYVHSGTQELTLLSTIFKFEGSTEPVETSSNWIILVDECHRTQEKELGAFLRATLPDAWYFGFTGTPVKKKDINTYLNFGPTEELYMDHYGIDDAVADGSTVPVRYTSRKADWQLEKADLDILFDNWFADLSDTKLEKLKAEGVTVSQLAKHEERIELLSKDIWEHFRTNVNPHGFKAQVVAIDRQAIILYKRYLDKTIAESLQEEGLSENEALSTARAMSEPVYSSNQEDEYPSEDPWLGSIREELRKHKKDKDQERDVIARFKDPESNLKFLIVCSKLLTGFDAPLESVMYLDSPLKEHNLLQAIARTNRVYGDKKIYGLIVDYIGVTKHLKEALSSYREPDVMNAMVNLDETRNELKTAHREVLRLIQGVPVAKGPIRKEYDLLVEKLGSEDDWFHFKRHAKEFIRIYEALSPDPFILNYMGDMKWIAGAIQFCRLVFEQKDGMDLSEYSPKIREILRRHLDVTGISTLIRVTGLDSFIEEDEEEQPEEEKDDLAALRKAADLKAVLNDRMADNPLRYAKFSDRIQELLDSMEHKQIDAAETLQQLKEVSEGIRKEDTAYKKSGLTERAYGIYRIIQAIEEEDQELAVAEEREGGFGISGEALDVLKRLASEIDELYSSSDTAPAGWHLKEQMKKGIRSKIRKMVYDSGITGPSDLKVIPKRIEEYALRFYVRAV